MSEVDVESLKKDIINLDWNVADKGLLFELIDKHTVSKDTTENTSFILEHQKAMEEDPDCSCPICGNSGAKLVEMRRRIRLEGTTNEQEEAKYPITESILDLPCNKCKWNKQYPKEPHKLYGFRTCKNPKFKSKIHCYTETEPQQHWIGFEPKYTTDEKEELKQDLGQLIAEREGRYIGTPEVLTLKKCPYCDATNTDPDAIKRHIRDRHNEVEEPQDTTDEQEVDCRFFDDYKCSHPEIDKGNLCKQVIDGGGCPAEYVSNYLTEDDEDTTDNKPGNDFGKGNVLKVLETALKQIEPTRTSPPIPAGVLDYIFEKDTVSENTTKEDPETAKSLDGLWESCGYYKNDLCYFSGLSNECPEPDACNVKNGGKCIHFDNMIKEFCESMKGYDGPGAREDPKEWPYPQCKRCEHMNYADGCYWMADQDDDYFCDGVIGFKSKDGE